MLFNDKLFFGVVGFMGFLVLGRNTITATPPMGKK
jgi:hypothetical protein